MDSRIRDLIGMFGGAFACAVIASCILTGFPEGLIPNLQYPYVYAGDALSQYAMTQRAMEGWVFYNDRLGYPFGSPWLDYPGSDNANWLIMKTLGAITGSYYGAANTYFILGFFLNYLLSFFVLRKIGISFSAAACVSVAFAFSAYGLSRQFYGHTFYTWYFTVPLYFYVGYKLYKNTSLSHLDIILYSALLLLISSMGVYFSLFGVITILICGILGYSLTQNLRIIILSVFFVFIIILGVSANLLPNVIYEIEFGQNEQVAVRYPVETEVYSLKLMHLVAPPSDHRIPAFATFGSYYRNTFPLSNTVSYLGLVGLAGLIIIFVNLVRSMLFGPADGRTALLILLSLTTFLVTTVGGFNVLFAITISPSVRGWDRFSIFILFYALSALGLFLTNRLSHRRSTTKAFAAISIVVVAILDQTSFTSRYLEYTNRERFEQDREFYAAIEATMPDGSAIYQIPYVPYPEEPPLHNLSSYEPLAPFINTQSLKWSGGGMRGREASNFYHQLSEKPMMEQIATARDVGLSGILIQGAGYADGGEAVTAEVTELLGKGPTHVRRDGLERFFSFDR